MRFSQHHHYAASLEVEGIEGNYQVDVALVMAAVVVVPIRS